MLPRALAVEGVSGESEAALLVQGAEGLCSGSGIHSVSSASTVQISACKGLLGAGMRSQ